MKQNKMLAMILAGGRGSRLYDLTNKVAKPAVAYGGKYRIVDFPLSNCANSGIEVVGVLTQYESVILNSYVAAGGRWGLDTRDSGVFVLPPRQKGNSENVDAYRGTADAISQNIDFIDTYDPEYLLVLSGDHIYKMNYDAMLDEHKARGADVTIAVLQVPWKEAPRFGIMNTDAEGNIVEFEEKPKNPKSNLASMGIYIFTWKTLREKLIADMNSDTSSHDFGKDIIPVMLADNRKLIASSRRRQGSEPRPQRLRLEDLHPGHRLPSAVHWPGGKDRPCLHHPGLPRGRRGTSLCPLHKLEGRPRREGH